VTLLHYFFNPLSPLAVKRIFNVGLEGQKQTTGKGIIPHIAPPFLPPLSVREVI
jgi:hypothetical protein